MRLAAFLVLTLAAARAQEPLEVLRRTAETYKNAKSWVVDGTDTLERSGRGQPSTSRRTFRAVRRDSGMRVSFADGGIRLTDGRFEWNYNPQTKRYTKKTAPWDSRGRRAFNEFFYNYQSIADFVRDAGFLGTPGKDDFLIEVSYALPGGIEEVRNYWIDGERYVVLRETSHPAAAFEQGPVSLTRTVTFREIALDVDVDPQLLVPPPDESRLSGAAPDFSLPDLAGKQVSLRDLRGHRVLLYFWATWCAICRVEMTKIEEIARAGADRGLIVLGINDEDPGIATEYLEAKGHSLRSLVDRWQEVFKKYEIAAVPATILISEDGRILCTDCGADPEVCTAPLSVRPVAGEGVSPTVSDQD